MIRLRRIALAAAVGVCAEAAAAQPVLQRAQVTNREVTGSLEATVRALVTQSDAAAWIGWEVPAFPRQRGDNWCWSEGALVQSNRLEPADTLFVFVRAENRAIERIRIFDDGCPIDAGDRPVAWLRSVKPAESIALLAALAAGDAVVPAADVSRASKGALAALSQHAGPEAVRPLLRLARSAPESKIRGEALFWLAQRAGQDAAAAITDAITNDPDTAVKKRAVFALSQMPRNEGVPRLIEVARTHANPAVRKQAIFWLGQSKDERALAFFEEVLKR
jgi:hypothetical protein